MQRFGVGLLCRIVECPWITICRHDYLNRSFVTLRNYWASSNSENSTQLHEFPRQKHSAVCCRYFPQRKNTLKQFKCFHLPELRKQYKWNILFFNCQHHKIGREQLCCNRLIKNVALYKLFAVHDNYWTNKSGFSTRLHDSMIVLLDQRQYFLFFFAFNLKLKNRSGMPSIFPIKTHKLSEYLSLARPIMKYSHPEVISNVFFRSDIHQGGGELPPRPKYHLTYWFYDL